MVESADFDGTNDWMTRGADLTGISDGKTGIISAWIRVDGSVSSSQYTFLANISGHFIFCRFSTGQIGILGTTSSGGGAIISLASAGTYTNSSTWLHCLFGWDLANAASAMYINDVSVKDPGSPTTNDIIDYTSTDWIVGASSTGGGNKNDGCIAELYFAPGQYLDFSVTNNRRKFITSSLKPVYLGADGAGPTGTAPAIYLHLDPGETVADFATNRGTGGNFTITGALTAGSTSPSDF